MLSYTTRNTCSRTAIAQSSDPQKNLFVSRHAHYCSVTYEEDVDKQRTAQQRPLHSPQPIERISTLRTMLHIVYFWQPNRRGYSIGPHLAWSSPVRKLFSSSQPRLADTPLICKPHTLLCHSTWPNTVHGIPAPFERQKKGRTGLPSNAHKPCIVQQCYPKLLKIADVNSFHTYRNRLRPHLSYVVGFLIWKTTPPLTPLRSSSMKRFVNPSSKPPMLNASPQTLTNILMGAPTQQCRV